ncbi:hypothetical protein HanPI659440_Chr13g0505631 [Helianthus annuus]|nr:hypothetical protein HanPI659440_Chr13g0505631 [Helianthus annuus]
MSMLWAPQNPRGFPVYGYKGKGYSLMIVFDPNAGGAMVVAVLPEGRPLWVDQIRDNFLHPTSESMATYANTVLVEDDGDDTDVDPTPTREEPIILLSEESADSYQDLIHHSARAGPQRGAVQEPVADDDKTEEKKPEEPVAKTPRKRPSNSSFLDYVVVSDTLSGLDVGFKRQSRDPDDDSTLTEMMKKRKMLEDKKRELDVQAAAALAEKKAKLQKETIAAPSESEIDLGVFSEKTGNRLEKIFKLTSAPRGTTFLSCICFMYCSTSFDCLCFIAAASKPGRSRSKIDIYKITPPASPPSKPLDLSPPRPDLKGKGKEDDVEVEQTEKVVENVVVGAGRDEVHAEGVETECESSEATPQGTVYTKRVRGSGGGGAYGTHQSPEFHRVQGGSWTTHNPACDDLPHVPHWALTQGSRSNDLSNWCEFYSLSLPPAERLFQKNRHRMDLLDDHIHAGVNFYATTQEIVRDWQVMGEDTLEFEAAKREFAEEREAFNAEKKGLSWRVADGEEKVAKEKQFNADR